MPIKIWALVCLILSSTLSGSLASGECCPQAKEDKVVPEEFNLTAFTWNGNNTTSLQRLPDEEAEAILESLLDAGWVGNNTTYLQKIPEEKVGAVLGDLQPSVREDDTIYVLYRAIAPSFVPYLPLPVVLVVDYALQKWLEKKNKEKMSLGSSGFTCQCGVDYTKAMHAKDCCATVKQRWNGKIWEYYFGNCEGGCDEICESKWDPGDKSTRPHWKHNICSRRR